MSDFLAQLQAFVGIEGPTQSARHPITTTAIADWCDAIGDKNPLYVDDEAAAKSRHGGIVAPPATLDIWDRPGLPAQARFRPKGKAPAEDPRSKVLKLLEDAGYVGVVAVNSELEIVRYLRPGDLLQNTQVLEDVSAEKQTALGTGHFVTTRQRYETVDGEHVGDLLFRILKFKPGTGTTPQPAADSSAAPDPSPELRPRPSINRDNAFLFEGYRKNELRIPRCNECGHLFFPPQPRCVTCGSFDVGYVVAEGSGTVYSHTTVHYPQVKGFGYPLSVAVVELDAPGEGRPSERSVRMVSNIVGVSTDDVHIGMPVEVEWLEAGDVTLPQFRPATPQPSTETLRVADISADATLPPWVLPVVPTQIVAGALATRDFQDVHHDRDLAVKKGSKDIFFNINTSVGLMERYVTDWAGPEAMITALRVRLGAPSYPYSHLTFRGSVQSIDAETGRAVIAVAATNELGPHITGTVELELSQ